MSKDTADRILNTYGLVAWLSVGVAFSSLMTVFIDNSIDKTRNRPIKRLAVVSCLSVTALVGGSICYRGFLNYATNF
jgi:hypothetical protein